MSKEFYSIVFNCFNGQVENWYKNVNVAAEFLEILKEESSDSQW